MGPHLSKTIVLGWSVDRDEDKISLFDGFTDVGWEEEVFSSASLHNVIQTRLEKRQNGHEFSVILPMNISWYALDS